MMRHYTLKDVENGLGRLRTTLHDDVIPILKICMARQEGGYFIIPREVFAYVDFLGALHNGFGGEKDGGGRRRFATTAKATAFLQDVFGKIDANYSKQGKLAYEMFRHGTVHVHRPHALRRQDGATIEWLVYKGERHNAPVSYDGQALRVGHLEPFLLDASAQRYILPLSINILFDDLLKAIDLYEGELKAQAEQGDMTLLTRYESTMEALMEPESTELRW